MCAVCSPGTSRSTRPGRCRSDTLPCSTPSSMCVRSCAAVRRTDGEHRRRTGCLRRDAPVDAPGADGDTRPGPGAGARRGWGGQEPVEQRRGQRPGRGPGGRSSTWHCRGIPHELMPREILGREQDTSIRGQTRRTELARGSCCCWTRSGICRWATERPAARHRDAAGAPGRLRAHPGRCAHYHSGGSQCARPLQGSLLSHLYYRFGVFKIDVPALREQVENGRCWPSASWPGRRRARAGRCGSRTRRWWRWAATVDGQRARA